MNPATVTPPGPVPKEFHRYFWEVDTSKLTAEENSQYIIGRMLEWGNDEALHWLFETFGEAAIRNVLLNVRFLPRRSANFWALYFEIDPLTLRCTKMSFPLAPEAPWNR